MFFITFLIAIENIIARTRSILFFISTFYFFFLMKSKKKASDFLLDFLLLLFNEKQKKPLMYFWNLAHVTDMLQIFMEAIREKRTHQRGNL